MVLCRLDDIEDGAARGFRLDGDSRDRVFLVRRGRELRVYRNRCPHQGASLPWQRNAYLNAQGDRIVCAAHGAQFDITSGRCVLGPALGQALTPIDVTVDAHGDIRARVCDLQ